ncbi:MAG: hypothetical protein MK188_07830 [Gammaproteobacteria bacterium]|nr:hypothetical protein [Gammaproteobacteria bacterium]
MFVPCKSQHCPDYKSDKQLGLALLSVLLFAAIISIISMSAAKLYLVNTQTISNQAISIQSKLLDQAALRFAIFDILKARNSVAKGGVPNSQLIYQAGEHRVFISVQNEAALLDLSKTAPELLDSILRFLELDTSFIPLLRSAAPSTQISNFRQLKRYYINDVNSFEKIAAITSFYNGSAQINRDTAPLRLIAALPSMSPSKLESIRVKRENARDTIVSDSIDHPLLNSRASDHYRITTRTLIGLTTTVKTHIVKIDLSENDFHKIIASL